MGCNLLGLTIRPVVDFAVINSYLVYPFVYTYAAIYSVNRAGLSSGRTGRKAPREDKFWGQQISKKLNIMYSTYYR